jgi:hypothetical protein
MAALLILSVEIWARLNGVSCRLSGFVRLWKLILFSLYVCGKLSVVCVHAMK